MTITLARLLDLLEREEETVVLELLDISSEELVKAFGSKLRQRKGYVAKYFEEENLTETEEQYGVGVHIEGWEGGVPFGEGDEEGS